MQSHSTTKDSRHREKLNPSSNDTHTHERAQGDRIAQRCFWWMCKMVGLTHIIVYLPIYSMFVSHVGWGWRSDTGAGCSGCTAATPRFFFTHWFTFSSIWYYIWYVSCCMQYACIWIYFAKLIHLNCYIFIRRRFVYIIIYRVCKQHWKSFTSFACCFNFYLFYFSFVSFLCSLSTVDGRLWGLWTLQSLRFEISTSENMRWLMVSGE